MKYLVVSILLFYALQAGSCRSPRVESEELSLIKAIKKGDTESALASLPESTDLNKPDQYGTPPLHWACYADKTGGAAKVLLKHEANISAQDRDGWTALDWAELAGNTAAFDPLIRAAICQKKLGIRSMSRKTLLHFAVLLPEKKSEEMVESLLQFGLDPKLQDNQGRTPLHYAVGNKKIDIKAINSLLKAGADPSIRNSEGFTPLHCVHSERKDILCQLLRWPLTY